MTAPAADRRHAGRASQREQPHEALLRRAPAACCFDFDGLLVDTAALWERAYADVCAAIGVLASRIDLAALHGASVPSAAGMLSQQLEVEIQPDRLLRCLTRAFRAAPPVVLPGVGTLLGALTGCMRLLVVTNGPRQLVEESLIAAGLDHHFDAVVSAELVDRPKPAPDVYLAACREVAARPSDAVAFEDSSTGARSARAAGLRRVGVPSNGAVLEADLVVPRLDDPRVFAYLGLG
jgi:HAD superfamily hydrolase (TIGR01509 family)